MFNREHPEERDQDYLRADARPHRLAAGAEAERREVVTIRRP